jgi:hypothetical protein
MSSTSASGASCSLPCNQVRQTGAIERTTQCRGRRCGVPSPPRIFVRLDQNMVFFTEADPQQFCLRRLVAARRRRFGGLRRWRPFFLQLAAHVLPSLVGLGRIGGQVMPRTPPRR